MAVKKILIIDDEKDFCDLVKMNLSQTGKFEVHTANNGKEGLKGAKKVKPDLILLDVIMPKMGGLETLDALKKDEELTAIPVVMLTALTDDTTKSKSVGLYAEHYLTKPISLSDLVKKINEILP